MSLAALKKKTKNTKNIKIGFKKRINQSYSQTTNTDNSYIMKPNMSYYNIYKKYNNYKDSVSKGECDVVVAIEPDLTGEHRVEVLSSQHLKKENMEKMKHIKREPNDRCDKKNELNYKDDDMSKTALSAQFVMNKKKACLIDGSFLDPTVTIRKKKLFIRTRGRGSILTNMKVELFFIIYENLIDEPIMYLLNNQFLSNAMGETIISVNADDNGNYELRDQLINGSNFISHSKIVSNTNNRILVKYTSTSSSIDTDVDLHCINSIDIKRDYEATTDILNNITDDEEIILGDISQDILNVNVGTTIISKLLLKNSILNTNYIFMDDLSIIIGVNKDNLNVAQYGQTITSSNEANILEIDKALTIIDQIEKKNSVLEDSKKFDVMELIQESIDIPTSISNFDFTTSTVITDNDTKNVLNEIKELTNSIIESNVSDENKKELMNLITISNQDNDLYTEIEANFDEDAINNANPDDDISDYADILNILDVSSCY